MAATSGADARRAATTSCYELAAEIVSMAGSLGLTVACAEACTGGLVAAALTDVPGSSSAVMGGVVSYAVSVKERVLGVPVSITRDPEVGVVSEACARSMAEGVRRALAADIGVSTTGIAGPGGAEPGKPVGTVCFAVSSQGGTRTCTCHFEGSRTDVREAACHQALELVFGELERIKGDGC